MEFGAFLVVWGLMCVGVAALASSRGRSWFGFFLLSLVFSPLLGLIVVLVISNLAKERELESHRWREEQNREAERKREHEKQIESLRVLASSPARGSSAAQSPSSPAGSIADELTKLAALRDKGVLTADEFEQQKRTLLGRSGTA